MYTSVAVLAETSLTSPRKTFIFTIKKYIYGIKSIQKNIFNFEKNFTDVHTMFNTVFEWGNCIDTHDKDIVNEDVFFEVRFNVF